jgi:hypothetical protein
MDRGSYQVEASDEGLMTDDIENRLSSVLDSLHRCDLPTADVRAWCTDMINADHVGFLCNQELRALRERFKA